MASKLKITKNLPSYLEKSSKGGLLIGFIYVIAFMSILFLAIWQTFESENNKSSMKLVDERLSLIEEQINIVDETNNDSMTDITSSIQFLDKEIRKLWDLSNKRNRKNISQNLNSIEAIQEKIDLIEKEYKTISAKQRSLNLKLSKLEKMQENLSQSVEGFNPSVQDDKLEDRLTDLEEAAESIDSYRTQVNQSIFSIKQKLNDLELEIINIESEKATSNE